MSKSMAFLQTVRQCINQPLKVLDMCDGLYICPKIAGRRTGPLVAYRGTYAPDKRFVGDLYANWAKVEQWPSLAFELAASLLSQMALKEVLDVDVFCGAPEGGKHLADKLAYWQKARYAYPEDKGKGLGWGRHEIWPGDRAVIVEDVSNNFTTTEKIIGLIRQVGGVPVAIATYLNRSQTVRDVYQSHSGLQLPVCALVSEPYPEYQQDDPAVAADVGKDNVVWDVKNNWSQLKAAMQM